MHAHLQTFWVKFVYRGHWVKVKVIGAKSTHASVLNAAIRAADEGKVTCLVLLDLSAAFDTVDHDILLDVLQ